MAVIKRAERSGHLEMNYISVYISAKGAEPRQTITRREKSDIYIQLLHENDDQISMKLNTKWNTAYILVVGLIVLGGTG